MRASSNTAFKEWAVVVDALGRGEQVLILRKGGIRESRGEFHVDHTSFWLFPTQYHEAERSIIPSKRPALRELVFGHVTPALIAAKRKGKDYFALRGTDGTITERPAWLP